MPGVKIGDGAIVAANSVVAHDIPPYTVFGGNPAEFIKRRFDDELTALLLRFRWWDLEPETLVEILPLLCDPDLDKVKRQRTGGADFVRHLPKRQNGRVNPRPYICPFHTRARMSLRTSRASVWL